MSHSFSFIDLTSGKTRPLQDDQALDDGGHGIKVFVLPYRNIEANWSTKDDYCSLRTLTNKFVEGAFQTNTWIPDEGTYLRFKECGKTDIDSLCQSLIRPLRMSQNCLVFLHATAFRKLMNIARYSATTLPSFLLRDDGALRRGAAAELKTEIDRLDAWLGAGWLSLTQRRRCPERSSQCYEQLGYLINDECKLLCERHLLGEIMDLARRPSITEIETKRRQVARLLTAYLPRFRDPPYYPGWQAYGADAETGRQPLYGPVRWDSWLDQRMSPLEQDLLFEGWLTPFADVQTGRRTLQPASLTLLFWAARVMNLPFTENPQSFINHHDWRGWFGGRCQWKPAPSTTG